MQFMESILSSISDLRGPAVHAGANGGGAQIRQLIILGYLVIIFLFIFLHRRIVHSYRKAEESLVMLYDTVRYHLAKEQYADTAFQDIRGIASILESDNKRYAAHAKAIQEEIHAFEDKEGHQIIPSEIREMIAKKSGQKNRLGRWKARLGIVLMILTLGIYRIFL